MRFCFVVAGRRGFLNKHTRLDTKWRPNDCMFYTGWRTIQPDRRVGHADKKKGLCRFYCRGKFFFFLRHREGGYLRDVAVSRVQTSKFFSTE